MRLGHIGTYTGQTHIFPLNVKRQVSTVSVGCCIKNRYHSLRLKALLLFESVIQCGRSLKVATAAFDAALYSSQLPPRAAEPVLAHHCPVSELLTLADDVITFNYPVASIAQHK